MKIALRATSHLAKFVPASGKVDVEEGSKVDDLLRVLGIDSDLVMLIVVSGKLGGLDTPLSNGIEVELIPPISGG